MPRTIITLGCITFSIILEPIHDAISSAVSAVIPYSANSFSMVVFVLIQIASAVSADLFFLTYILPSNVYYDLKQGTLFL